MAFRVFISYSTRDMALVNHVKHLLEDSSIEVFVAEYSVSPSSPLAQNIIDAIKDCHLFIVLWGENSRTSEWVQQEIGIATSGKKPILPVLLTPGIALPGFIRDLKYLPVYDRPEEALAWLRANVFARARKKQQEDTWAWVGIAAAVLFLATRK